MLSPESITALKELAEFNGDTGTEDYIESRLKHIPAVLSEIDRLKNVLLSIRNSDFRNELNHHHIRCAELEQRELCQSADRLITYLKNIIDYELRNYE